MVKWDYKWSGRVNAPHLHSYSHWVVEVSTSDVLSSLMQKLILSDTESEDLRAFCFSSFLIEWKSS